MIWRIVRSRAFIPLVLVFAALLYWRIHSAPPKGISVGYVGDRNVVLWNTLAEVRQPVAEAHYGDRLEVLRTEGTGAQVRTASGTVGWLPDSRQIMDSQLWTKSASLLDHARTLPVQARGRTKTVSNLRVEPGRDGKRIFQFMRGTPVLILERAVADASQASEENPQDGKTASTEDAKPKQEDWFLVLRSLDSPSRDDTGSSAGKKSAAKQATSDAVSGGPTVGQSGSTVLSGQEGLIAGWVLARFIELDLPDPVKDYASSANLRVVAWFELNRVPDGSGGEAPQYLVAGSRGAEGQPCDFTMLRVYTWGTRRKRYETAYVESDLCGRLPIRVSNSAKGPEFRFAEADGGVQRTYVMQQTAVRRVKDASSSPRTRK
ncbi:MAG TPA: hypothetical protein VGT24_09675 [Candidatus Acidoferrales bacterium]|nr:hypothetical protein [Candidatus Acidoferrales bacterium]